MVQILAGEVILWTTGGLPKPFEAFLPPVTCRARLTQKGWRETFHAEYTSHFCLCASSANLPVDSYTAECTPGVFSK